MKKFFFIAILAMASLVSNAQVFVGGSFGAQLMSQSSKGGNSVNTTLLTFKPEIGYKFGQAAVGLRPGITYIDLGGSDNTLFNVEAFGRYNFVNVKQIHFGGELGIGYVSYGTNAGSGVNIALRPVLTYDLSKKTSLFANFNLFEYTGKSDEAGGGSEFGVGLLNGASTVSIGIMVNL